MPTESRFWDRIAEKYAAQPVTDPAAFDRKIAVTRAAMTPAAVVLDIGCGTGSLALRLASAGAHVHGLDVSGEMIRIARAKAAAAGVGNVTFHVGPFDARFTALAEGSLDGVCAYSLLHLIRDRPAALAQILRLLKPGGFFISSTPCLGAALRPVLAVMRWVGKAPWVAILPAATLDAEITAAGFTDLAAPDVGAKPRIAFRVARRPG
ncbi:MAG: class I SAM-dependent methyltransferase [bacterium]